MSVLSQSLRNLNRDKTIRIRLLDNHEQLNQFKVIFDSNGEFIISESTDNSLDSYTVCVELDVGERVFTINGDAWRDIESGDYLQDFIQRAVFGDEDPNSLLSQYATALGIKHAPGKTLSVVYK